MRKLRRLLDFIASRIFFFTLIAALFILVFFLAMHTANIWILVDEGLEVRASVVLTGEGEEALTNYFREEFIAQDPVLRVALSDSSPYRDYIIRSFRHEVSMLSVWCWPWESTARAEIIERVPSIDGTIQSSSRAAALEAGGEDRLSPPAWEAGRYRVTLIRSGGRWKISNLQLIGKVDE